MTPPSIYKSNAGEQIAARMQRLVPHLTTSIIPDAGHALINSRARILPFLAASTPPT